MLGHNNIFKWENNGGESNLMGHRENKRVEIAKKNIIFLKIS